MKMHEITSKSLFKAFLRLGLTAFGGPAMIAYIQELAVNRKQWLDDQTFKHGVALCQSIPGATAMQMAAYVGLKVKGLSGAFASYIGFGLPAFIIMLTFSMLYERYRDISQIISLFNGLQVIVVAIVANAFYVFSKGTIKSYKELILSIISAALLWSGWSPFIVIVVAALAGIILFRDNESQKSSPSYTKNKIKKSREIFVLLITLLLGLVALYIINKELFNLSLMMLKIDLFAFGGGYGSLPLMLHEVVDLKGWLDYRTFMDGIALGQVTPGPIVITATFVGYLTYGLAGAVLATIAIFTPSFLILLIISPFFDKLKTSNYFLKIMKGILASFVGLLFFVMVKFSINIQWDLTKIVLGMAALIALFKKVEVLYIVILGAIISVIFM